jgi:hypothetical protein
MLKHCFEGGIEVTWYNANLLYKVVLCYVKRGNGRIFYLPHVNMIKTHILLN